VRYRFVREHQQQFPIGALCRVMQVASSGYYAWRSRPESPRRRANRALTAQIRAAHSRSRKTYGRRRIHAQLQREGIGCSPNRVARLMHQEGLQGVGRRKFRATTDSRHSFPVAANLLARDFTATAPDQVWVSDITYLRTEDGWDYLATVMDLYSRRIVGWAMQSTLERSLTLRALEMAVRQRRPGPGLIHHSDRGSQYACCDYQAALQRRGLRPSMSRKGDCWDNAPARVSSARSSASWSITGADPPASRRAGRCSSTSKSSTIGSGSTHPWPTNHRSPSRCSPLPRQLSKVSTSSGPDHCALPSRKAAIDSRVLAICPSFTTLPRSSITVT
jgi:putative transposase